MKVADQRTVATRLVTDQADDDDLCHRVVATMGDHPVEPTPADTASLVVAAREAARSPRSSIRPPGGPAYWTGAGSALSGFADTLAAEPGA